MTAASEPDILAGVERAAKALGIRAHHGNDAPRGWRITKASSNGGVLVMHQGATHRDPAPFWTVSPAIALAFCLLLASDAGPVDVGRCPECEARGGSMEWRQVSASSRIIADRRFNPNWPSGHGASGPAGWSVYRYKDERSPIERARARAEPGRYRTVGVRPCPACNGTGREMIPVARLLLDAAQPCSFCDDVGDVGTLHRRPCLHCLPRQRLRVHVDRLQAEGDLRGELLALALGPWSGHPVDFGPCDDDRCEDGMTDSGGVTQWDTAAMVRCPACKGSARMLGHPHTAAALRWLEWLTWAREFDQHATPDPF
jgi:hypothetical protein